MKKLILFCIILFSSLLQLKAQWIQVNTNTTENLYDMFFVDSLEGYCVGGSDYTGTPQSTGVILQTLDGGENWTTIFSKDSTTIRNIAVVEKNGIKKLYAVAIQNYSDSYLVSDFLGTNSQGWSIDYFGYLPLDRVKVYNDEIYFVNALDLKIQKIDSLGNLVELYLADSNHYIYSFDVNDFGISYFESSLDSIYYSKNYNDNYQSFAYKSKHILGNSQLQAGNVSFLCRDSFMLIKGIYPSATTFSFDNGNTWAYYSGGGESKSLIINDSTLLSIGLNLPEVAITKNWGENWKAFDIPDNVFLNIGYSKYTNTLFAIGKHGAMYKHEHLASSIGLHEPSPKESVQIYPNPTKSSIHLVAEAKTNIQSIKLLDINGKLIKTYTPKQSVLDIKGLPAGVYILNLKTEHGMLSERVIIE
ncbi:MAG: T9SS type A sorting domain-containing protein [Flavobacteriales bacterium]